MFNFQLPFMRSQPGWMAFHREGQRLSWLSIARDAAGKPQVLGCGSAIATPDSIGQALSQTPLRGQLKRRHCLLTLASGEYQVLQAEMPAVPDEEVAGALRWSIADMLEYPAEDAGVDFMEIPGDASRSNRMRMAFAVCARRTLLRTYLSGLHSNKAKLSAVDVPETAHRNLAALVAPVGRGIAMVGITIDACMFTFSLDGELCAARRIDIGLGSLASADAETRERLFDRILLELQRSLDAFEREFHFASLAKVIVSPVPEDIGLHAFLKGNLSVAVEPFDVGAHFDLSKVPALQDPSNQAQYLTLFGAALRPEVAK